VRRRLFRVEIRRSARKDLLDLPARISEQIERAIDRLEARLNEGQPPQDVKKLQGRADTYRIDSGEYRILFALDEQEGVVTIARVRHRKDVYRNL
jgi:mRNA interferase RelE/StbE